VLAAAVGFYRLGSKSLWLDESISASYTWFGPGALAHVVAGSPNMGLYYVLLSGWARIFGRTEAALRSLSVVAGALAAPATALLGRRLFDRRAGVIAGLLIALSPLLVHYEQTVRSYALLVLAVVLSSYLFVALVERPARVIRVAYVLSSAAAVYVHLYAVLVLLAQLIALVALGRGRALTRAWRATWGAILLLCAPEALLAAHDGAGGLDWIRPPTFTSAIALPVKLAGGWPLGLAVLILAAHGARRALVDRGSRGRWRAWFLLAWALVPTTLALAASALIRPLLIFYYLIGVAPALALLAAAGLRALPTRALRLAVLALLLALSGVGLSDWYRQPSMENFRAATAFVLRQQRPGDRIVYYPHYIVPTFAYYGWREHGRLPRQLSSAPRRWAGRPPRLWVAIRDPNPASRDQHRLERSISSAYGAAARRVSFDGVLLMLYRLP
jgi:mannosyltransferase